MNKKIINFKNQTKQQEVILDTIYIKKLNTQVIKY